MSSSTRRFWIPVSAITLLGLAWRVIHTFGAKRSAGATGDAFHYHHLALLLREGRGFISPFELYSTGDEVPTALYPPLYSVYLAGWTFLGVDTPFGHRLVTCLVGAATIVVVALVAKRLGGTTAGIVAAILAASYPMLWINDSMLLSESMAALMIAIALLFAYRFWDRPNSITALLFGATFALAMLARAEMALILPIVAIVLVVRARIDWKARLRSLVVMGLAALVIVGPWVGRNLTAFEHPVWLSNGAGATIRGASCDEAWYGPKAGLFPFCPSEVTRHPDESVRDREARELAFDYIGEHRDRLPALLTIRVLRGWELYAPFQNTEHYATVQQRGHIASFAGLWSFYLLMPLAIAGIVVLWQRRIPVVPFVAIAASATFTAATFYANVRYRLGIEVGVVALAAVALGAVWDRARR